MNQIIAVIVSVLAVILYGCSPQAVIDRVDNSTKVLAFGDSLTFGYGAQNGDTYPALLSKLLKCDIENCGVSGDDTTSGLNRLPAILKKTKPDLVLLCYGGNDMLQRQPREKTKRNIDEMISLIKAQRADIVLIAVPQPGLTLPIPDLYEELARKHRLPLEKKSIRSVLQQRSLKSDMIHPNSAGYKIMADHIYEVIQQSS